MRTVFHRLWTVCAILLVIIVGLQFPFVLDGVRADSSVNGHWEQLPLYGGIIFSLVIDPLNSAKVYAGTSGGVFRSDDHGVTWKRASDDLPDRPYACVAIDPVTTSAIYAGTFGGGVALSHDYGATWDPASAHVDGWNFWCLAIDSLTPSTIYAGTSIGIWRSADRGESWSPGGLLDEDVHSLVIDPSAGSTMYAGTGKGVFGSSDGGMTWVQCSSGISDSHISCLAIDSLTPSVLYAGTQGAGVFRSGDRGNSWTAVSQGLTGTNVRCLAIDPATPTTLYAGVMEGQGVFRSIDGGGHWEPISKGLLASSIYALAIDTTAPGVLYAASSQQGMFKTTDAGVSWKQSNSGLHVSIVMSLASGGGTPPVLHVATVAGYFRCDDAGWMWWDFAPLRPIKEIGIVPASPSTLCAAAGTSGVYWSKNAGDSWTRITGPTSRDVACIAFDLVTGSTMFVGTDSGVFRSTNWGQSWTVASTGLADENIRCLAMDSVTPSTLYAGTDNGIFRSGDLGDSWKKISTAPIVGDLAIDPDTPNAIYAAGFAGVYRSRDRGTTWTLCSDILMIAGATALAIDPVTTSTVYVGTTKGVFRSNDGGDTWMNTSAGLPASMVNGLSIVPGTPTTLYASTDRGLFRWIPGTESAASPPSIPDGLLVLISATAVTLIWPASTAGTSPLAGYAVYRSTTAGSTGDTPVATVGAAVTSWTDAGCQQGVTYYYAVAAFDNQGTPLFSGRSSEVSHTVGSTTLVQPSPPSVPKALTAASSVTTVTLSWSASTSWISPLGGYAVYRSTSPGGPTGTAVATVGAAVTSWTDTACRQGITYYYTVAAFDSQATPLYSEKSSEVSAKLLPLPPIVLTLTLQLGNRRMLVSGSDGTSDTVTLDAAPVLGAGNRTLVPVRAVAEAMGGTVGWDPATRTASVTVGSNTLELTLGKNTALFNGTATPIDTDPKVLPLIINGRTMLPLRFVVESLGADVSYDQATKTITITYTKS